MQPVTVQQVLSDKHFMAAVLAAMVFWGLLLVSYPLHPQAAWPLTHWREAIQVAILYPLIEEGLFRGLIQGELIRRVPFQRQWRGLTLANLLTSGVFVAAHFFYHPPLAALGVLIPSLLFGYFRDRHRRLLSPFLLHGYYNLGYFWLTG